MSLPPPQLAPVVSEKSYSLTEVGKYTFEVHPDAHKTQVRQAVEEIFNVTVVEVRMIAVPAKPKRRGMIRDAHRMHNAEVGHLVLYHMMIPWAMSSKVSAPHRADNQLQVRYVTVD